MYPSSLALKAAVIVHFILTVWASMSGLFLPLAYTYMNLFVLLIGLFAVVQHESVDAMSMFLVLHVFTILQDTLFLIIYQPRAHEIIEKFGVADGLKNEYRFCLGTWKDRRDNVFDLPFTIYGMGNQNQSNTKYELINQPVPSNSYVETASTPHEIDDLHAVP